MNVLTAFARDIEIDCLGGKDFVCKLKGDEFLELWEIQ